MMERIGRQMEQSEWGLMESWLWIVEVCWELDDFFESEAVILLFILRDFNNYFA
jgi:hypothetical protein